MLIDAPASEHRNAIKKESDNILKYKTLPTQVHHIWNVQAKVTSVKEKSKMHHCTGTEALHKPYGPIGGVEV
jgi:hypothetical protein